MEVVLNPLYFEIKGVCDHPGICHKALQGLIEGGWCLQSVNMDVRVGRRGH